MSKTLNATKNRTTGNKSKRNFIAPLYRDPVERRPGYTPARTSGPICSQVFAPARGEENGRTPHRAEIPLRRRACSRRLLVVPLRGFQKPAVLRRHAQGDGIFTGEIHREQGGKALAVRLQAHPQPAFLRRHAQDALAPGSTYFFVAVQRPSAPPSVRNEPSMVPPVTRPVKSRRTP